MLQIKRKKINTMNYFKKGMKKKNDIKIDEINRFE